MSIENPTFGTEPQSDDNAPERNPAEQMEHLKALKEIVQLTGFIETEEMKAVRNDVTAWATAYEKNLDPELDMQKGLRASVGHLVALASIYYEQRNADSYFDTIDSAFEVAERAGLTDLVQKIQALE